MSTRVHDMALFGCLFRGLVTLASPPDEKQCPPMRFLNCDGLEPYFTPSLVAGGLPDMPEERLQYNRVKFLYHATSGKFALLLGVGPTNYTSVMVHCAHVL